MIKDFTFRIAFESDISEMQSILQLASRDWSPAVLPSCFGRNYKQWVVCFESTILGFVIAKVIADYWEILQIVIHPDYQRQGLAARLLQFVIHEARKMKIKKIQLEVRRSNHAAQSLYRRLNFAEVGIRKKYYSNGEDAVLMDCLLG
jgi:ribosomal-protein-alanine N-acetyltransferase